MRTKFGFILAIAIGFAFPTVTRAQSTSADPVQVPQPAQGGVNWQGVGVGAGTLATNVVYIPAKLVYGILGGIAGGAGYAVTGGNQQVANTIWRSSLGGDYVVTPDMLTGKQPVHFSGPTTVEPPASAATAASSSASGPTSSAGSANANVAQSSYSAQPTTAHPMDSGTGPVSGGNTLSSTSIDSSGSGSFNSSSSYSAPKPATKSAQTTKKAAIPDTSIE
jgi:hypothetical protein